MEAGFRTTLVLLSHAAQAAPAMEETPLAVALRRRDIGLVAAAAADPLGRCLAVDEALAGLRPDVVHAPERHGVLAAALSRRAAGLAHLNMSVVLHARGPTLFQMEEQARFIGDVDCLLLDDLERQAMRMADRVVCCSAEVARYLATGLGDGQAAIPCRMVAPLVWPLAAVAAAEPTELVFPLPLCSEAGLEFAVAALARATARRPLPLPVTFLGQPDAVTIGNAALALAGLAPPPPPPGSEGKPPRRLHWRVLIAETPQRAMQFLAKPGRVALLTSTRATPPEMLAMCGQAGIPVIATTNAVAVEAARRWPGIHLLPRAERGFGAALARLPSLPELPQRGATPPAAASLDLMADAELADRALALLAEPDGIELTLLADARPSLVADLAHQTLRRFALTLLLPAGSAMPEHQGSTPNRPVQLAAGGAGALGRELLACKTRYAVLCGAANQLVPDALHTLLRAARATGAAAIAAWDGTGCPVGGGGDLALLRPGSTVGHVVLLDLPLLRARGGNSLSLAGTRDFAAALATESGGVLMLAAELAEASAPPESPNPPPPGMLPPRLQGAASLALHFAAGDAAPPLPPEADEVPRAMAGANRDSAHYLKLVGRMLDGLGLQDAAADAWGALIRRDTDDGETWLRHCALSLAADGRLPDIAGLARFVAVHGEAALGALPDIVASHALDMLQAGRPVEAMRLLREAAPVLQGSNAYIQALARSYARLSRAGRRNDAGLPSLAPAARAALKAALANFAVALPAPVEEEAP